MTRTLVRVLVAGVLIGGCGNSESSAKPQPASTTVASTGAVTVKQFQFMPAELAVQAGTEVTWTNEDDILHTATSGATPGTSDGQFDGPMDGKG